MSDQFSLLVVSHKPRFIELADASSVRRPYPFPSREDDMIWLIPSIDELGASEGSYLPYVNRLKIKILQYELETFHTGPAELNENVSEGLCDELLDVQVYAKAFPIDMILKSKEGDLGADS